MVLKSGWPLRKTIFLALFWAPKWSLKSIILSLNLSLKMDHFRAQNDSFWGTKINLFGASKTPHFWFSKPGIGMKSQISSKMKTPHFWNCRCRDRHEITKLMRKSKSKIDAKIKFGRKTKSSKSMKIIKIEQKGPEKKIPSPEKKLKIWSKIDQKSFKIDQKQAKKGQKQAKKPDFEPFSSKSAGFHRNRRLRREPFRNRPGSLRSRN